MTADQFRKIALEVPAAISGRTWIILISVWRERFSRHLVCRTKVGAW